MVHTNHSEKLFTADQGKPEVKQGIITNETAALIANVGKEDTLGDNQLEGGNKQILSVCVNGVIPYIVIPAIQTVRPIQQKEEEQSYTLQKDYIFELDGDLFSVDQELYGDKDTGHKIGDLIPYLPDELSGKQDEVDTEYQSDSPTVLIPNKSKIATLWAAFLQVLAGVKEEVDQKALRDQLKFIDANCETKRRSEKADLPEPKENEKKTALPGSRPDQKNLRGDREDLYVIVTGMENFPSEGESNRTDSVKKNFLFSIMHFYFGLSHEESLYKRLPSFKKALASSRTHDHSQKDVETFGMTSDFETSKHSMQSIDVKMKSAHNTRQSWIDSGGGIPYIYGEVKKKLKPKDDDDDSGIGDIDQVFHKNCDSKRKNSIDLSRDGHRRWDNPSLEDWRNNQPEPMMKLDAAFLFLPAALSKVIKSQQDVADTDDRDSVSSVTEESTPVEERSTERRSEADTVAASQRVLVEDSQSLCEDPVKEEDRTVKTQQLNVGKSSGVTGSSPVAVKQRSSATDGKADHHPVSGESNSELPECSATSPVSQTLVKETPEQAGPTVFVRDPVQVSSPENSQHIPAAFSSFGNECYDGTFTSTLHDRENVPRVAVQESQSERGSGACGATKLTQEPAYSVQVSSCRVCDSYAGVAEEIPITARPCHHPEQPEDSINPPAVPHFPAIPEPPASHSSGQGRCQSAPSHSVEAARAGTLQPQSAQPVPLHLPSVTVHAASALPPGSTRTAHIDLTQATDRNFVQLRTRRETYDEDWPNHSGIDAANMALAGFFIIGPGRRVRCFYCGLELDHLTSAHNIWDEHVRLCSDCPYLNAIMGRDLVENTLHQLRNNDS